MTYFSRIMFALTICVLGMKLATNAQAQSTPRQRYETNQREISQYQYEKQWYDRGMQLREEFVYLAQVHRKLVAAYRVNRTWEIYDELSALDRRMYQIQAQVKSIDRYLERQRVQREKRRRQKPVTNQRTNKVNSNLIRILNENRNRTVRVPGGGPPSVAASREESLRLGRRGN